MKNAIKNMPKNQKVALGVIAIIILAALIIKISDKDKVAPVEVPMDDAQTQDQTTTSTKKSNNEAPKLVVTAVDSWAQDTRSYADLVLAFKDKTLQFGKNCQVRMSSQIYKSGSQILLDNRNDMSISIKLGSDSHMLPSYGHKIVSLSTEGQFMVSCNEYQNVATITVQK